MSRLSSSSYSSDSTIAFSKIAGLAVTPRMPSSRVKRSSSPDWMSLRPIRSSHGLWPTSFSIWEGFIVYPLVLVRAPSASHLEMRPAIFCGVMP